MQQNKINRIGNKLLLIFFKQLSSNLKCYFELKAYNSKT